MRTIDKLNMSPEIVKGDGLVTKADLRATIMALIQAMDVEEIVENTVLSGTSMSTCEAFLQVGLNVVTSADENSYAIKLPYPPKKGTSVTVINTSLIPIVVYPSVDGGSVNDAVNGGAVVPNDGKPYVFYCWENPLPGSWSVTLSESDLQFNTRLGKALSYITTGSKNTGSGYFALYKTTTGDNNVANGYKALFENLAGENNVAVGYEALLSNTSGKWNVAVGAYAFNTNTTGNNSVAVGYNALRLNTTGTSNTAIGAESLKANITGSNNTALGNTALYSNTTASDNTGIGFGALQSNTTGQANTAIGSTAMQFNTTGDGNTAVGNNALHFNTTGSFNSVLGTEAQSGNFSGCVILGVTAAASGNNQFVVGSPTYNAGAVTTETITPNRTWTVRINGVNYKIPMLAI